MNSGFSQYYLFFFFNDTATTEIYTLSLHDALPISARARSRGTAQPRGARRAAARRLPHRPPGAPQAALEPEGSRTRRPHVRLDRKSTRLNSSHLVISYAVFCLKKKKTASTVKPRPF